MRVPKASAKFASAKLRTRLPSFRNESQESAERGEEVGFKHNICGLDCGKIDLKSGHVQFDISAMNLRGHNANVAAHVRHLPLMKSGMPAIRANHQAEDATQQKSREGEGIDDVFPRSRISSATTVPLGGGMRPRQLVDKLKRATEAHKYSAPLGERFSDRAHYRNLRAGPAERRPLFSGCEQTEAPNTGDGEKSLSAAMATTTDHVAG